MKPLSILVFSIFLLLFGYACKHYPAVVPPDTNNGGGGGGSGNSHPCDPDTVYFNKDILPILVSNCAKSGCHDATTHADGVILTNYNYVIQTGDIQPGSPANSDLYERITETKADKVMPPPPASHLSTAQIQLINKWILQGAKNLTCDNACDTLNVTYSKTIKPLIQTYCQGCHSGTAPSGSINLSTYAGVKTIALNGKFYGAIAYKTGFSKMPKNGNKLSDCQIKAVDKWIKAGALQN